MWIMPWDGKRDYKKCRRHRDLKSVGENKAHMEQLNDNESYIILNAKISYRDKNFY